MSTRNKCYFIDILIKRLASAYDQEMPKAHVVLLLNAMVAAKAKAKTQMSLHVVSMTRKC